jgi:hypothetical protein
VSLTDVNVYAVAGDLAALDFKRHRLDFLYLDASETRALGDQILDDALARADQLEIEMLPEVPEPIV